MILFFTSCKKHRAKRLSGYYECEIYYVYYDMSPFYFDTTYKEVINIKNIGKAIEIFDHTIPSEEVWDKKYRKDLGGRYYFTLELDGANLDYYTEGGGRGGGFRRSITGIKID